MGDYSQVLPLDWEERYQSFLAQPEVLAAMASSDSDRLFKAYPRVVNGQPPLVEEPPAPAAGRVALVSTAGIHLPDMAPFRWQGLFGDTDVRRLPLGPLKQFAIAHGHYDEGPVRLDQNVLWPARRLQDLAVAGEIGALADTGYTVDGYDAIGLVQQAGEQIVQGMQAEGADIALIVPV